jgi:hypothetical protein
MVEMKNPASCPCAMVRPVVKDGLIWVVDEDAANEGIVVEE